ncbi:DUF1080 domain-containing protein [Mucilaginibacter terrenus]|uniref:DUF1080 domain-containing protein n=1 Tax=Mucilaginibacter terrenus TaxID=2482727 RepID=A0A3E2NWI4_9SPHI|nr:DUF1080 domain-containing protein [Mucilaginibacter terrenus]RFZ85386.1 DUF1080 domain-containing protein [Mucilaginibacter terrenus]
MKTVLVTIIAAIAMAGCNSSSNTKSVPQDSVNTAADTSWTVLFDGKTTNGWHTYGKTEPGKAWKAEDGILHLDARQKADWQTKDGGDLLTNDEFENYEFTTEWKISKAGNSGIIFNVKEDPKKYEYCWYTGIETQVVDNQFNEDGQIPKHRTGELYDLISISKDVAKPYDQWNKTTIILKDGVVNILLNNEQVLTTKLWTDDWKKLVASSKFKEWPDFGTFRKGHIALQDHGADVWYRNIKIRKL